MHVSCTTAGAQQQALVLQQQQQVLLLQQQQQQAAMFGGQAASLGWQQQQSEQEDFSQMQAERLPSLGLGDQDAWSKAEPLSPVSEMPEGGPRSPTSPPAGEINYPKMIYAVFQLSKQQSGRERLRLQVNTCTGYMRPFPSKTP